MSDMSATSDNGWRDLIGELDAWAEAGRTARLWWRDDDACEPTPALDRLIGLADRFQAPLALAVIPARATRVLARRLEEQATVTVLQHGYAHINHAAAGEPASEFGDGRELEARLAEIAAGWRGLSSFTRRAPIFVPPWNRCGADLPGRLKGLGFGAISGYGARRPGAARSNLLEVNCHCDIIDWRSTRGFIGEGRALARLVQHLRICRLSDAESGAPTGLLTHHLQHDEACWRFVEELLQLLERHEAARWINASEALPA